MRTLTLVITTLALTACTDKTLEDTDVDTGRDGDTEAEVDTEADTEADTEDDTEADTEDDTEADTEDDTEADTEDDTDPAQTADYQATFSLDRSVTTYVDGVGTEETCTAEIAVTGSEFVGDCNDCTWAFALEATGAPTGACDDAGLLDAVTSGDQVLTFFSDFNGIATDTLTISYQYIYNYGGIDYPYFFTTAYLAYTTGGETFGQITADGLSLDWTSLESLDTDVQADRVPESDCQNTDSQDLEAALDGSTHTSDLACNGVVLDVWELQASAGDTVSVTVDTVGADTAFDPLLTVVTPSGCITSEPDDSFTCTFEPLNYECPGSTFTADESGTYELLVQSLGSCVGDTASYRVSATNQAGSVTLTLADDDLNTIVDGTLTLDTYSSTGTFRVAPTR